MADLGSFKSGEGGIRSKEERDRAAADPQTTSSRKRKTVVISVDKGEGGVVDVQNISNLIGEQSSRTVSRLTTEQGPLSSQVQDEQVSFFQDQKVSRVQTPQRVTGPTGFFEVADLMTGQSVDPLAVEAQKKRVAKVSTTTPNAFNFTEGRIDVATEPQSRFSKFRENVVGDPLRAFTAFPSDVLTFFGSGGKRSGAEVRRVANQGTIVEQVAGIGGIAASFALPGRTRLGSAETALLRSARTAPVIGGRLFQFVGGLAIGTAEATAASSAAQARLKQSAPEEFKPFLQQNDIFRTARSAEVAAEPSFLRQALGGVNPSLNQRQLDVFRQSAREQLQAEGFSGQQLETGVEALMFRRTTVEPASAGVATLAAGRFAEIFGRQSVSQAIAANPSIATGSFATRAFNIGSRIAPAGIIEVRGERSAERARLGTDLPVFDGPRSLLPAVSFENGFSVQPRSRVGQDIMEGAFAAGISGLLGGLAGAGATAPKGLRGAQARGTGKAATLIGNIADVSEPFTDILAGPTAGLRVPVIAPTVTTAKSPTINAAIGLTPSTVAGQSSFPIAPSPQGLTTSTVPANVPISPLINIPTNPIVPTTPTSPRGRSPINVFPEPIIGVTPQPQPEPPVPPQPIVPVAAIPTTATIPVASFVGRIPPPVPLSFGLGGSTGKGRAQGQVFVNELAAALSFSKGGLFAQTIQKPQPQQKTTTKKTKKTTSKKKQRTIFDNSLNLFPRGVRFV